MASALTKKTPKAQAGSKDTKKVVVDFSAPANDSVFDGDAYAQYLKEHIKVEGKAGNLGDKISINKESDGKLSINATGPFSKRYVKYLSKKYLKRENMRDWLRVVATQQGFKLVYYNVNTTDAQADEE